MEITECLTRIGPPCTVHIVLVVASPNSFIEDESMLTFPNDSPSVPTIEEEIAIPGMIELSPRLRALVLIVTYS